MLEQRNRWCGEISYTNYAINKLLGGINKYQDPSTTRPNVTPVPAEVWRLSEVDSGHTGLLGEVRGLPFPKHFIMLLAGVQMPTGHHGWRPEL